MELLTAAGHQVVGLDLRGHGQSSKPYCAEQYETSLLASDVVRVLNALSITRSAEKW